VEDSAMTKGSVGAVLAIILLVIETLSTIKELYEWLKEYAEKKSHDKEEVYSSYGQWSHRRIEWEKQAKVWF
jgi:hypothetical protein